MEIINSFNAPIYEFDTIDSTNKYAKNLCINNPSTGTLIISSEQTQGRGRFGNVWESPKNKGLYYSIIFKRTNHNLKYETLTLFISLGITKLLEDYSIPSKIKWPNDILVNNKKICGILSEGCSTPFGDFIIIGIGVNLYHEENDFKEEIRNKATSLKLNTNSLIIKNYFINNLTRYIFEYYNKFLNQSFENIIDEYTNKSCLLNREISVKLNGKDVYGNVFGFDNFGHLILRTETKTLHINSGDVSLKDTYKKSGSLN